MYSVETYDDVGPFESRVRAPLERDELRNNQVLRLLTYMTESPRETGRPFYAAVVAGDALVGAAIRTGETRALSVTEMPGEAARVLAEVLRGAEGPKALGELFGPERVVAELADALVKKVEVVMVLGFYATTKIFPPAGVHGRFRRAVAADEDILVGWSETFAREALDGRVGSDVRPVVRSRIEAGRLGLWELDGRPVSQAHWVPTTLRVARVSGVFTPPELRGRGYASSCVAATSLDAMSCGFEGVCLYADLANPTSNAIYQKIGYERICEERHVRLVGG